MNVRRHHFNNFETDYNLRGFWGKLHQVIFLLGGKMVIFN